MQLIAKPEADSHLRAATSIIRLTVAGYTRESTQAVDFHSREYPHSEAGYEFSGRVELTEKSNYVVLRLADLCILRSERVKEAYPLQISFEATVHGLEGAVEAGSALCGNFNNKLSHHILGRGNKLSFRASVNDQPVAPEFRYEPAGETVFPQPFGRSVEPVPLKLASPWTLRGELTVELGSEGDSIMIAPIIPAPAFHARITLLRAASENH